jgi:WD40 repeat protein
MRFVIRRYSSSSSKENSIAPSSLVALLTWFPFLFVSETARRQGYLFSSFIQRKPVGFRKPREVERTGRTTALRLSAQGTVGLAFSSDDAKLISRHERGTVQTWDIETGRLLDTYSFRQPDRENRRIVSLGMSSDRRVAAMLTRNRIDLWDIDDNNHQQSVSVHVPKDATKTIAFDPTNKLLSAAGGEPVVNVWRLQDGQPVLLPDGHTQTVLAVAFSPDGNLIASGGADGTVRLWDVNTSQQIRLVHAGRAAVHFVNFSEARKSLVAVDKDAIVRSWNLDTGKRDAQFSIAEQGDIFSYAFLSGERVLLVGTRDGRVGRINITDGKTATIQLPGEPDRVLAFTKDGQKAATISYPGRVSIWQISEQQRVGGFDYAGGSLDAISFSSESTMIVTARGLGSHIRFWRVRGGTELGFVTSGRSPWRAYAFRRRFAFSPDGKLMATEYESGSTVIWDVATRKEHQRLLGHESDIRCLAISPDGRRIATGSADTTVLVWPVRGGLEK